MGKLGPREGVFSGLPWLMGNSSKESSKEVYWMLQANGDSCTFARPPHVSRFLGSIAPEGGCHRALPRKSLLGSYPLSPSSLSLFTRLLVSVLLSSPRAL